MNLLQELGPARPFAAPQFEGGRGFLEDFASIRRLPGRYTLTPISPAPTVTFQPEGMRVDVPLGGVVDWVAPWYPDAQLELEVRLPVDTSAGVNRIAAGSDLTNAAWVKRGTCVVTPNVGVAPDGTTTADQVLFAAQNTGDFYQSILTYSPSVVLSTSLWVRTIVAGTGQLRCRNPAGLSTVPFFDFTPPAPGAGWVRITDTTMTAVVAGYAGIQICSVNGSSWTCQFWGFVQYQSALGSSNVGARILFRSDGTGENALVMTYTPMPTGGIPEVRIDNWVGGVTQFNLFTATLPALPRRQSMRIGMSGVGPRVELVAGGYLVGAISTLLHLNQSYAGFGVVGDAVGLPAMLFHYAAGKRR